MLIALRQKRGERGSLSLQRIDIKVDRQGRALIDISAIISPRLVSKIEKLGGLVIYKSEKYQTVRAHLALNRVESLASDQDVRFIAAAFEPLNNDGAIKH